MNVSKCLQGALSFSDAPFVSFSSLPFGNPPYNLQESGTSMQAAQCLPLGWELPPLIQKTLCSSWIPNPPWAWVALHRLVLQNTMQSAFPSEGCSNTLSSGWTATLGGEWAEIASGWSPKPKQCCSRMATAAKTCADCWVPRKAAERCPGQGGLTLKGLSSFPPVSCNPVIGSVMATVVLVQKCHKYFCSARNCHGVGKSLARFATDCWL